MVIVIESRTATDLKKKSLRKYANDRRVMHCSFKVPLIIRIFASANCNKAEKIYRNRLYPAAQRAK